MAGRSRWSPWLAGRKAEKKVAKRMGARLRPNSGAMEGAKGDMTLGNFLIEAKSTQAGGINLQLTWLRKIVREVRTTGQDPALVILFTDVEGNPRRDGEWVAVPRKVFERLVEGLE